MEKKGFVSLWLGTAGSEEELEAYVTAPYDEEGDALDSPFMADFGIEDEDEDFREIQLLEQAAQEIAVILSGHSYDDVIIPRFQELSGPVLNEAVNAVILLYNFAYSGQAGRTASGMTFIGTASYEDK
ncbi:immunity 22 family protein [Paenibacillus sp. y28]|uniref:immunity 22 family protein n=1 Tax=Paenibacillus sp. y28 TaxID=3129110 RepID=UPI0030161C42